MIAFANITTDNYAAGSYLSITNAAPASQPVTVTVPRRMSEAQAWRAIARRLEQCGAENGMGECLRREADRLYDEDRIWYATRYAMKERIRQHLAAMRRWWQWRSPKHIDEPGIAGARILACYWLALEAEEETMTTTNTEA